jgi:hypothetical protein
MPPAKTILRDTLRAVAVWGIMVGVTVGVLGFAVDASLVQLRGAWADASLAAGLAAGAFGGLLGLLLAPIFAALHWLSRALLRAPLPRVLAVLPVSVAALVAGMRITHSFVEPTDHPRHPYAFELIVLAFVGAILILAVLWLQRTARWARVAALAVALGALAYDVSTPRDFYRDAHDLAAMLTTAGLLAAARPVFTALFRVRVRRLCAAAGALLLAAIGGVSAIDTVRPGWRTTALRFGHYLPRAARAFQLLVDLDNDGFSPVAWGGDCDDLDAQRNPYVRETAPGYDDNCNGIALPDHPTFADRGLAPPEGDPELPPGAVDRFLLITIDCLRLDAARPEVMPRLAALAARGITFTRLYAGGSHTLASLPLTQRGHDRGEPAATRLSRHAVTSTHLGSYFSEVPLVYATGFDEVRTPDRQKLRWDAAEVTDHALADLAQAGAHPHYLWAHYYDAHTPYVAIPADVATPGVAYPRPAYLARLAFIDRELGRLVDALDADGRLARTALVVVSDHGEALGSHGLEFHGLSTYEPLIHVPAVLVAPGVAPGVYNGLASHRDLAATIPAAFGVGESGDAELFGRSWFRLRAAPRARLHRFVITRSARTLTVHRGFLTPQMAIIEGQLKLTKTFEDGFRDLFDVVADPGELENLEPTHAADAAALEHQLELYRDLDAYP